jgi:hypothetical protein
MGKKLNKHKIGTNNLIQKNIQRQKKLNILWNLVRKLDNININYKPIRKPIKNLLESKKNPKNNIDFFLGIDIKNQTEPNHNQMGRFGFGLILFYLLFFFKIVVWLFLYIKTKPNKK